MNKGWRKLFLGYGSATLVQGAVGFVIVPLLLALLGQNAFAKWAMIEPLVPLLGGFALAGIHYASLHTIGSGELSPAEALRVALRYGSAPAMLVLTLSGFVLTWWLELGEFLVFAALLPLYLGLEAAILLMQFQARAQADAISYALTVWVRSGGLLLSLMSLSWYDVRWSLAQYLGFMITLDLVVLGAIAWRHRQTITAMRLLSMPGSDRYKSGARYGLPIVAAAALAGLVANGDRYVIFAMLPPSELTAYVVMSKLAGAMTFAIAPIGLWWPVARHRHVQDSDGGQVFFSAALPVVLAYFMFAAASLWLIAGWLLHWYAPGVDGVDHGVLFLLLAGGVALGMTAPVNIGTLAPGKTYWMFLTTGFAAVCGFCLAIALVPGFGYMGAAVATLVAQTVNVASIYFASQRIQPVRLNLPGLFSVLGLGVLMFAALWSSTGHVVVQVGLLGISLAVMIFVLRRDLRTLSATA